ncbi:adenylosuccinate synthetase, partial [Candidatus Bathyarchaeota archaeon]
LARRAAMLNGATQVAVTKLDAVYPQCRGIREYGKLPSEALNFIARIEEEVGLPVTLIGTGPDAEDIIDLRGKS